MPFFHQKSVMKKMSFSSAHSAVGVYIKRLLNEVVKCNYNSVFNINSNATLEF